MSEVAIVEQSGWRGSHREELQRICSTDVRAHVELSRCAWLVVRCQTSPFP